MRLKVFSIFVALIFTACTREPAASVQLPTLARLPSATQTSTPTTVPSATWTPDILGTQVREGNLTNEVAQTTLTAIWEQQTSSPSPVPPTLTITSTSTITETPTIIPTATLYPTAQAIRWEGCDPNAVAVWTTSLVAVTEQLTSGDEDEFRNARTQIEETAYPQCTEPARRALLRAFEEALASFEAQDRGDYDAALLHAENGKRAIEEFEQTLSQVAEIASYSGTSQNTYLYDSSGNIQFDIMCADGTMERVWTSQGACSGNGGTWNDAHPYIGGFGSGILCEDGTISNSSNRRGACSHHGGIAD